MPFKNTYRLSFLLSFAILGGCASKPPSARSAPEPAWINQPVRTVDAGYIVYIGSGQDGQLERATFKAESMAIADLANECSFAPKGTRVEDRYDEVVGGVHYSYAKIGVTFEECEGAKKALQPEEIHRVANVAMAEQLKRYQDLYYAASDEPAADTGEDEEDDDDDSEPAKKSDTVVVVRNDPHFFVFRQRMVYYKQDVILAPTAYRVGAPARAQYLASATPVAAQMQTYEAAHPTVRQNPVPWSEVQRRPGVAYPRGFRRMNPAHFNAVPHVRPARKAFKENRSNGNPNQNHRRRRRRRNW